MIIVQLHGGLGNQLFQYAAGLSLARHHNVPVKVDISLLQKPKEETEIVRNFELKHIQLPVEIATENELQAFLNINPAKNFFEKVLPRYKRMVYREPSFAFDPHFFSARKNVLLKGYRQSERYFEHVRQEVRSGFILKDSVVTNVVHLTKTIRESNSVSIHIRRGDYKQNELTSYHGLLTEDYYKRAIDFMLTHVNDPVFHVFSDDIKWVRQNITLPANSTFVTGSITTSQYEDFYLMSQCRHNIIANSSFSWWAAWLNDNSEKKVISPANWFGNAKLDTSDLIPSGWIRM